MNQKGFTIIEILVSIGVLTFVVGIGIVLFISLTNQYSKANVITNLEREGSRVAEQMTRTIRSAETVTENGTQIELTIPPDPENLEYSENGGCERVEINFDSTGGEIEKTTKDETGSACGVCASTCILNNTSVGEVSQLGADPVFAVTLPSGANDPYEIEINFRLSQPSPAVDQVEAANVDFRKKVLTRSY